MHHGGGYFNVVTVTALNDVTGVTVNGGGPFVVCSGSVVLGPSAGGFVVDAGSGIGTHGKPEVAGVQLVQQLPLSVVGPYDTAGDGVLQFGSGPATSSPVRTSVFPASGLLQKCSGFCSAIRYSAHRRWTNSRCCAAG